MKYKFSFAILALYASVSITAQGSSVPLLSAVSLVNTDCDRARCMLSATMLQLKKLNSTPVFSSDFTGDNPMAGWTAIDKNGDGNIWVGDKSIPGITYNGEKSLTTNDLLLPPALNLESGKDYAISYSLRQSGAFVPDNIKIVKCDETGNFSDTDIIDTAIVYLDNGLGEYIKSLRFTASETGAIQFAILVSNAESNGKISLSEFKVGEISKPVPMDVSTLEGTVNSLSHEVQLKWVNPSKDTEGLEIKDKLDIEIYEDDVLVKTLLDRSIGEGDACTFTPHKTDGMATFVVKTKIGDAYSAGVSIVLNLNDVEGEMVLLKAFDVNSATAKEWKTEDYGGTSSWVYDYGNVFSLIYNLNQKDDDWLFSPKVELTKGTRYVATYELKTSMDYSSSIDFSIGTDQTRSAVKEIVCQHVALNQNGFAEFKTKQFSVDTDGTYSFGFHVYDDNYSVSMRNLRIFYINPIISGDMTTIVPTMAYDRHSSELRVGARARVDVYDIKGNMIVSLPVVVGNVNLSFLVNGVYIVKVTFANGNAESLKIVK